ncbi:[FeFe] hydrogenase H-cluster radical SAM maturase HydG [Pseudothermotoga sp.]|uniref:[FeFe] hydrogenase H-cluster radical SAM maturase HydG n=1 Tax=Pseudothermotoga sp. TaxID=2033661 RepID=UPI0031F6006A
MFTLLKKIKEEESFIPHQKIEELLEKTRNPESKKVETIVSKALQKERLSPEETAVLLNADKPEQVDLIVNAARRLKEEIYGNRIVLFAPLYIGNWCINNCQYCGFRMENTAVVRKTLSDEELEAELYALTSKGHKRLIVVFGEHPMYSPRFIARTIERIYSYKNGTGQIRRVNVNAAPQTVEGYKIIKEVGIGTFQIFQETYHLPTYKKLHPSGPKSSYVYRLFGLDRAMAAGIDDVGIGALFGLYDWKFEVMGLMYHTKHLEERFGVGPHTISFPRVEPAFNTPLAETPPHPVSDEDFKRVIAIIRLSVPYTGLILTARERPEVRREVLKLGVSQIDAGSSIGVGSYSQQDPEIVKKSQFILGDTRSLDEVIKELAQNGHIPSFCTACYRAGRTGQHFMEFAIPGFVKEFCTPNAILTFKEYLLDYASEETKKIGEELIKNELDRMPPERKKILEKLLVRLETGERDVRL